MMTLLPMMMAVVYEFFYNDYESSGGYRDDIDGDAFLCGSWYGGWALMPGQHRVLLHEGHVRQETGGVGAFPEAAGRAGMEHR